MKSKYKKGKLIRTICDFDHSKSLWFKVVFGNKEKTIHRAFLVSWQYHMLEMFISARRVYEAELNDQKDGD